MPVTTSAPLAVVPRFIDAANRHDLDALGACMTRDFDRVQPMRPDRAFWGSDQVRKNWTAVFGSVPDFRLELLRSAVDGEVVWLELLATGTRAIDQARIDDAALFIVGVRGDRIAWARVYTDEVRRGESIDQPIEETYH